MSFGATNPTIEYRSIHGDQRTVFLLAEPGLPAGVGQVQVVNITSALNATPLTGTIVRSGNWAGWGGKESPSLLNINGTWLINYPVHPPSPPSLPRSIPHNSLNFNPELPRGCSKMP